MNTKINLQFGCLTLIILLAAFSRIIPHMPNFSPLGAIGLFGAAHFDKKWKAFLIPVAATWLSDLFINNVIYVQYYPAFTWFYQGFYWQYGSYLLITLTGLLIFNKISKAKVLTGALASAVIFFLISNFGCWIGSSLYPQNPTGLMACYAAGIPFVKGTLLGNVFYSVALFGGYYLLQSKISFFKLSNVQYA
jgi:hypothetical protein